jgi:hypothetical protein
MKKKERDKSQHKMVHGGCSIAKNCGRVGGGEGGVMLRRNVCIRIQD